MGRGESLVQIHVQDVDAEIAGTRDAHHCIQIRSIHVDQRSTAMQNAGDLRDFPFEDTERIRIRDHDAGDVFVDDSP